MASVGLGKRATDKAGRRLIVIIKKIEMTLSLIKAQAARAGTTPGLYGWVPESSPRTEIVGVVCWPIVFHGCWCVVSARQICGHQLHPAKVETWCEQQQRVARRHQSQGRGV